MREYSPMTAAELMDKVIDVYKKSFWPQIGFAAILYAVMIGVVLVITFVLVFFLVFAIIMSPAYVGGVPASLFIGVFLIVVPFVMLWNAFASSGHILLSRQAFFGYKVQIYGMGLFRVFWRVISAIIAQIIITIPFILVAFLAVWMVFFLVFNIGGASVAGVVIFIISLLLVVAGYMIFSNIFALSIAVAVFEQKYFFSTIKRSWELIKPEFWRILGIRTIWYAVGIAFTASAQGIFMLAETGVGMLGLTELALLLMPVTGFAGPFIVTLLAAPLDGILHSLIYFNQRMKNEGFDINLRVGQLRVRQQEDYQ